MGKTDNKRLHLGLNFLIAAASILITGFCLFGVYRYVSNTVVSANISAMRELQEHDKKAINTSINYRVREAESLGESLSNQSIFSIQVLNEILFAATYQLKAEKIYLYADNMKFYSSDGTSETNEEFYNYVNENKDGFLIRTAPTSNKRNDSILIIGRPIEPFEIEGVTFSFIIVQIKLSALENELKISSYDGNGQSYIIDRKGELIVGKTSENLNNFYDEVRPKKLTNYSSSEEYIDDILRGKNTSTRIIYHGIELITLTTPTEQGWTIITFCPTSVFSKESNKLILFFVVLAAIMIGVVALLVVMILKNSSRKALELQLEEIKNLNSKLEEASCEQESQIEEITALNHQLEDNQAQLEESAAAQESQLEEISELNKNLEEHLRVIQSMSKVYFSSFYIDIMNNTFYELSSKQSIREAVGSKGNARESIEYMWKYMVDPEFSNLMKDFMDLDTIEERLGTNKYITIQYVGATTGWSQAYLIEGGRDSAGRLTHIFFAARMIHAEKAIEEERNQILEDARKQAEEARKQAEEANAAKTSFLFNMSHDIRTPMNAIIGFRDLLEKHQNNPERRAAYLRKIDDSSTVLLSIINNVLEMARIEKGTIEIDETAWSAEQFNDTLFSVFHEMMKQKGLDFTREIVVQHHYVYCDPIKLREVFINILSNAYKYTNTGGKVHMKLEELPYDKEGWVLFKTTISDTGIGMAEDYLPHLFEEFSREHNSTDNKIEGTGLGMSIVKRLVSFMNGTIDVKSKLGEGTTFVVMLPHKIADRSNLVEHAGVELDPKLFQGKRILLAEDNELNAEIAMEILNETGFIVERAEDGYICVDMVEAHEPGYYDLILMDIQMPNLNGYGATRKIRAMKDSGRANIPILAMTANAFEEDKREALRVGMNGHLAKPVNIHELMRELASVLS